jgi:hypothetical protein
MTDWPPAVAVDKFRKSGTPGVWPMVDKQALADDMLGTVLNRMRVDQGKTPFCGPAAIAVELIRRNPDRYVEMIASLYDTGSYRTPGGYVVEPSQTTRNSAIDTDISPADWVLLASMRDSENLIFPVEGDVSGISGITTPWEERDWAEELLGHGDLTTTFAYGELDALREAHDVFNAGGSAFLLIDSKIDKAECKYGVCLPLHWVVYQGGYNYDKNENCGWWDPTCDDYWLDFSFFSWGKPVPVNNLKEGAFEDALWSVVTSR